MRSATASDPGHLRLGVNLDHIATIRQARRTRYPDLMHAVRLAEASGADSITLHLREDRRHIQDDDVFGIKPRLLRPLNLEMAATGGMQAIALKLRPEACCIVPERREELTTEGGLDAHGQRERLRPFVQPLTAAGIEVSLFVEPDIRQLEAAVAIGAPVVELHTGAYANATTADDRERLLHDLFDAARAGYEMGLVINAGHGLDYDNVRPIAAHRLFHELNIGHSIIARALFTGLPEAVSHMRSIMDAARRSGN
ncbi:Pyridoxine 5'-phosphate synthase [Thioalkalivibrio nitratireducens DSM 14787]|uniref:Pyridoxine 5'-phosphate synthase n=1 Tax=Thioalkalivibrio nitratireducens (strain DSM 14787 / UNIQEM 213 / ALEN2) TaxID=1255043 RepID=L0DW02_THIND|nr:pyridoxine 5'-phosphate synthase [Thioalkalivibrio nitratireducens]AGA32521.1 Pyridoxine 5'-phosphate synthase [Thioalkalivibrio nitratireducens DSM 14787]